MSKKSDCSKIQKQDKVDEGYPEFINKEQFYKICHISKFTARYLLAEGLIPCENNGKGSHNYKIAMKDVVAYLKDRELMPEKYRPPSRKQKVAEPVPIQVQTPVQRSGRDHAKNLKKHYEELFSDYPDVLTVVEAVKMMGCSRKRIAQWIREEKFQVFSKGNSYLNTQKVRDRVDADAGIPQRRQNKARCVLTQQANLTIIIYNIKLVGSAFGVYKAALGRGHTKDRKNVWGGDCDRPSSGWENNASQRGKA